MEMSDISTSIPSRQPASVVTLDSACRKCGYNLRGLQADGQCPECGSPVALSVHGNLLRYSDPVWLRRIARGIGLLLLGYYFVVGLPLLAGAVEIFAAPGLPLGTARLENAFFMLLSTVRDLLIWIGIWLFTAPDPSGVDEYRYRTVRKIARIMLSINLVGSVLMRMSPWITFTQALFVTVLMVRFSAWIIAIWAQLDYLKGLAERLPDSKIVSMAKMLRTWLTAILGAAYLVVTLLIITMIFGITILVRLIEFLPWVDLLFCVAVLILGILFLILLHKLRNRLRQQATLADSIWAATPSPDPV
jgi:hypothetical protein